MIDHSEHDNLSSDRNETFPATAQVGSRQNEAPCVLKDYICTIQVFYFKVLFKNLFSVLG